MPGLVFEGSCSKQVGPNDAKLRDPALELPLTIDCLGGRCDACYWWLAGWPAFTAMPVKGRGRVSKGGSRQCDELPGLPTKDEAQEKWQRSAAVWLLAIRVWSWAWMQEREREKKGESKSGAEGVTADISLRVLSTVPLFLVFLSVDQNADRRGRPTWRSKRKSVPSSISARRIRTSA